VQVEGLRLHVSLASRSGSDLTFGRQLPEAETRDFPNQVREILAARGPKLRQHKELGRETWLVAYNTFWTATSPYEVEQAFLKCLSPEYAHVDHIGVVSGSPHSDAWVIAIR